MYFRYHKLIFPQPSAPPNFPAWFATSWSPTPDTRQSLLLYLSTNAWNFLFSSTSAAKLFETTLSVCFKVPNPTYVWGEQIWMISHHSWKFLPWNFLGWQSDLIGMPESDERASFLTFSVWCSAIYEVVNCYMRRMLTIWGRWFSHLFNSISRILVHRLEADRKARIHFQCP